jgi:hypothetical protein
LSFVAEMAPNGKVLCVLYPSGTAFRIRIPTERSEDWMEGAREACVAADSDTAPASDEEKNEVICG